MIINCTEEAMRKLMALSKASGQDEIGGIMIGCLIDNQIVITDITVPKQKVTASSISFDDESINEQLSELFFNESDVGFVGWWHTHGTGKTFWSSTDEKDGITKFLQPLIDNTEGELGNKWLASVVANAYGNLLGRVDYYVKSPFGDYIETVDNVPVVCMPIISDEEIVWAKSVIKANVSTYRYVYNQHYKGKQYKGYNAYYDWDGEMEDDLEDSINLVESQSINDESEVIPNFSKEDEELIDQAEKTYKIDRSSIEDLVNVGYNVAEAIDILAEGVVV